MYRYIGNKTKLLPHILEKVESIIGEKGVVADVMAGTGIVSAELKRKGYTVIASDVMTYSIHHLNTVLKLSKPPLFEGIEDIFGEEDRYISVINKLNNLEPKKGYFYQEFSPAGSPANGCLPRKYFTSDNAIKIDAIREQINMWINTGSITEEEESLLKHSLIMAVNRIANISGTYGYFLSEFKKNSLEKIVIPEIDFEGGCTKHTIIQGYAEKIARVIKADICYIDPPYMKRQYAANYHILETIARGDYPEAVGKSGLRDWRDQYSNLCTKTKGMQSFEEIVSSMNCKNFIISYSEDGLFSLEQLIELFSKYGEVDVQYIDYNRFRSNKSELPKTLKEYIITLKRGE